MAMLNRCSILALAAALTLASSPAAAQSDEERAGARAAAMEGETAFNEGRYDEAIDLFSRAEKLVHAPPHLLFIARAHLKLGHLVKARETLIKIGLEELPPTAPQAFKDAKAAAQQDLNSLEPRIPYLTVKVEGAEGQPTRVLIDGEQIPEALVGVPYPVDPGEHELQAFAQGMESSKVTVTLGEGAKEKTELVLEPTENPPPAGGAAPGADVGTEAGESSTGISGLRIGSYVSYGVGAVGLVVGAVFASQWSSKSADADAYFDSCDGQRNPIERDSTQLNDGGCADWQQAVIQGLDDDASSAGTLAVVGFGIGVVGIGVGTTLLVMDLNRDEEAALEWRQGDVAVRPWVGLQSAGVTGTF